MNDESFDNLIFSGKQLALPSDLWAITKLEYSDERYLHSRSKVIRVEFAGTGDRKVPTRRRPNDESLENGSTVREFA